MSHIYNSQFYDYINAGSRASARRIIPLLRSITKFDSVLDVGAGQGAWAAEWIQTGIERVVAVDGTYVLEGGLLVPASNFVAQDVSKAFDLGERFDLVQALEVAEHIPERDAGIFVDTLARHGDLILFSAAVPNQGGEHHVNEQPPEYWRRKFASKGFAAFDWLRPQLRSQADVAPWYRFNSIIYANEAGARRLAASVRRTQIPDGCPLRSKGSLSWYLRRSVVALMPQRMVTSMAASIAKHHARAARKRMA